MLRIYFYYIFAQKKVMENILIEKIFDSSIDKVWQAISDAESIAQWFMPSDLKAEQGTKFQFRVPPNENWNGLISCVVTKVKAPTQLSYSWTTDLMGYMTNVHWTLTEVDGKTKLELKHEGFQKNHPQVYDSNKWRFYYHDKA